MNNDIKKRSFITPELRPYVTGSKVTPKKREATIARERTLSSNLIVIASPADSTTHYFLEYLSLQPICYSFVSMTCIDSLLDAVNHLNVFWNQDRYPSIYFRDCYTDDSDLAQVILYLTDFLSFYPGTVINRPGGDILNLSKPRQMTAIANINPQCVSGIKTNMSNHTRIEHLDLKRHIVKSMSNIRSNVVCLSHFSGSNTHDKTPMPVHIQSKLQGTNIRVHVCGQAVFSVAIEAKDIDYRYSDEIQGQWIELPQKINHWCLEVCNLEQLLFAGIDLFLSEAGQWFCFEVNPSPGYHFFEALAATEGQSFRISESLCQLLCLKQD